MVIYSCPLHLLHPPLLTNSFFETLDLRGISRNRDQLSPEFVGLLLYEYHNKTLFTILGIICWHSSIHWFTGIAVFASIAAFTGISVFTGIAVFARLRCSNVIIWEGGIPWGGGGGLVWPPKFWPTTFFPRDFHSHNIRIDIGNRIRAYIMVISSNIQFKKCQLEQHFQA